MSLSYYYEFTAPAQTEAQNLEAFLREVEKEAKSLGFKPTTVLNVPFDTTERRDFSYRIGGKMTLQDERLKGIALPAPGQLRNHDPISGECRLLAAHGVLLVLTDEQGCEVCFGFFQFPEHVLDIHGATLAASGLGGCWWFSGFVDSPDARYRKIVERFRDGGYLKSERDEYE